MVYKNNFVIAIKDSKGRILREHGEEVYLPFGSEYSILLKNLSSKKASANIYIDGENVMEGDSLIVEPNSSIDLKRFLLNGNMNVGPRFKFIERTGNIESHRGVKIDDGIVRIEYQFERRVNHTWIYNGPNIRKSYRSDIRGISGNDQYYTHSFIDNFTSYGTDSSITPTCDNIVMSAFAGSPENENGITVKGSEISQNFTKCHIGDLEAEIYVLCLRLKGGTVNSVTIKSKSRCNVCGRYNPSTNKYCRDCGNNLNW